MYPVVLSIHILICLMVVLIILVQSGKGAGFSGLFGGGNSDALFNAPSGSMFLRKVTTVLACGFFTTALLLTYLGARQHVMTVTRSMPMNMPMTPAVPAGPETPQPAVAQRQETKPAPAAPAAQAKPVPKKK